ncbi:septal junction protein FraD [Aetokthonos hydrillicola Thurmond2011]|jgi:hypothetical protein|uniref:Septal junction protein FraD n=1 Tax=Aetokthonos hydrillicola Thurmond2011 TaxID=2712845 RepID=A0AAP5I769_9CYAN|nr:septal junction protein FraD [Aetokthonos hydrillicola]MBO3458746.1 DUF5357 domain-containing protein [Aetokthonos hydrillicola CCALA 1050]MBW4585494.1 septal junction protein FraD [Aetokthonos hydrillicola CCALA 1050]MDR9896116.1 septal junction protein FraD [Aetokthonos hydrillicola Thurmond2011]
MNVFFRDFLGFLKIFDSIYERLRHLLIPPKAYSWQTLIYLSLFSWLISSLSTGYVKELIAICGWLFLISGTAWYTTDKPLYIPSTNMPVGAVITGFLVSVFAFGQDKDFITSKTIVLWPTLAAIITAIPEFFEGSGTDVKTQIPRVDERQRMIVLVGSCMVISCWLQFCFVVNNWLDEYPSIQVDNINRSALVFKSNSFVKVPKNGVLILDNLTPLVEDQISKKPWSEVEQWLIDARKRVGDLGKQVIQSQLAQYDERYLWHVEPRISNVKSGYKLDLLSIWTGPSANSTGYYFRKNCRVDPVAVSRNGTTGTPKKIEDNSTIAEIECDRVSKFIREAPPPQ